MHNFITIYFIFILILHSYIFKAIFLNITIYLQDTYSDIILGTILESMHGRLNM